MEVLTHGLVRAAVRGRGEEISHGTVLEHRVIPPPKCLLDYQQFAALAQIILLE